MAASGSLSHRIRLPGRRDEFRELADAVDVMFARLEAHVVEQRGFAANTSRETAHSAGDQTGLLDVARSDPNRDSRAGPLVIRAVVPR
jgi:two-component system sensor histidine kinase VanS